MYSLRVQDRTGSSVKTATTRIFDFAIKIYGGDYEKIWYDLKYSKVAEDAIRAKGQRQFAKPGVLGAIYRMSGGVETEDRRSGSVEHVDGCKKEKYCGCPKVYDIIKTGLWGYAEGMGITMTQEDAHNIVRVFRDAYKEIPEFWKHLENMTAEVMDPTTKNVIRYVGPNNCVEMNRLNISGRYPLFRMKLPSGRYLHYLDARMDDTLMPWKNNGEDVYRPALWYAGQDQITKQWGLTSTHGGKQFENLVQGIARDVLAVKLLEFEEHDLPVYGHVHDEGISLVIDDPFSPGVDLMEEIMGRPIDWAPGLLLGADGFESDFYHK